MSLILCGLYLATLTAIGYSALSLLFGPARWHWSEVAGLSIAAGTGVVGVLLFVVSFAGFAPGTGSRILLPLVALGGVSLILARECFLRAASHGRAVGIGAKLDATTILGAIAFLVICLASINVIAETINSGLATVDATAIWMFKAKIVAGQPLRPIPAAMLNPSLSYSHQDYPLGFPLMVAGVYAMMGTSNAELGQLILLPIYGALVLATYGAARRSLPRRSSALAITALLVASPVVVLHAGMAVAESLLLLQHLSCLVLLVRWIQEKDRRSLIGSLAFAAFAAFTKNEGLALMPLVGLTALAVAAMGRDRAVRLADWLIACAAGLAIISPWLIYRRWLPRTHEDYGQKLTNLHALSQNLPRLGGILRECLALLVEPKSAGLIWVVLLVAAIAGPRRIAQPIILALWALLLAHIGLYVLTFVVTPWDLRDLLPMVGPKLLMHVAPSAALLIGFYLAPETARAGSPAALPRDGTEDDPARPKGRT